jgi:acyl carrier protein
VLRAAAVSPELRLSQIPLVTGVEAGRLGAAGRDQRLPGNAGTGQVFVVDRALNLVPRGVPGELLVGGEPGDLASGLRTGIAVRWSPDLHIEYLTTEAGAADAASALGGVLDEGAAAREPRTPAEEAVASIFAEVLSSPEPGAEENFFAAGGNSLQAMRAVSRINKAFGIKVSVRTMYGTPTVRAVAAAVDELLAGQPGGARS